LVVVFIFTYHRWLASVTLGAAVSIVVAITLLLTIAEFILTEG
jgi:hypothetical protein